MNRSIPRCALLAAHAGDGAASTVKLVSELMAVTMRDCEIDFNMSPT
jgi:hypothetical protein